jgi:hypothetical protein
VHRKRYSFLKTDQHSWREYKAMSFYWTGAAPASVSQLVSIASVRVRSLVGLQSLVDD